VGVCDLELGGSAILLPWWRRYEGTNTKCDREWRRADVTGQSRLPFRGVSLLFALRDPQNLTTLSIEALSGPAAGDSNPLPCVLLPDRSCNSSGTPRRTPRTIWLDRPAIDE
jgi:hypothetical protein